ncbi:MAG: choline-sulfatase [Pseudomonadota bacterium]
MSGDAPHIIFIQTDQLAANVLSAYGDEISRTPHIDQLADNGIVFETAYCNYPLCAPSRFSMATGMLASRIGTYDNAAEMPASVPTYAHYLRALGYQTCLSGKMHFVGPDQLHGFERRLTSDIYPSDFEWTADWDAEGFGGATDIRMLTRSGVCARSVQIDYDNEVTHRAVRDIYDVARSDDQRPVFLHVSYTHPHDPYLCLRRHWDLYDGPDIPMPRVGRPADADNDPHSLRVLRQHGLYDADVPDEVIMQARRAYYGSVSYIDDQVGQVMEALRASGLGDNAVVIFSSDHGEMLGERGLWLKKTFFDQALRVPLIVHAPSRFKPARVREFVSLLDLVPSLCDLASGGTWQPPVDRLDGESWFPLIDTPEAEPRRDVLAELLCEGILAPIFMLRRGAHKFISSEGDPDQLYDLEADPDETNNLAGESEHAALVAQLTAEIARLWDSEAISADIRRSQKRRLFIKQALSSGVRPTWDFLPDGTDDPNWFRGGRNYNDWAFSFLPDPEETQ